MSEKLSKFVATAQWLAIIAVVAAAFTVIKMWQNGTFRVLARSRPATSAESPAGPSQMREATGSKLFDPRDNRSPLDASFGPKFEPPVGSELDQVAERPSVGEQPGNPLLGKLPESAPTIDGVTDFGSQPPPSAPIGIARLPGSLVDQELASIPAPRLFDDANPSPAREILQKGNELLNQGKWNEAIEVFYKALEVEPANAQAYESLGLCYVNKNELNKAIANLDSAIRLNPKGVAAYVTRASANVKLKYNRRALDDLGMALKLEPENLPALVWRSIAYLNDGQPREARSDATTILKLNSQVLDAYLVRCLANLQLGDPNGVRADYKAAVDRGINADSLKMMRGWFEAFGQKPSEP